MRGEACRCHYSWFYILLIHASLQSDDGGGFPPADERQARSTYVRQPCPLVPRVHFASCMRSLSWIRFGQALSQCLQAHFLDFFFSRSLYCVKTVFLTLELEKCKFVTLLRKGVRNAFHFQWRKLKKKMAEQKALLHEVAQQGENIKAGKYKKKRENA